MTEHTHEMEHTHDWRVDPYTFYPAAALGEPQPVKVVCIVTGCYREFIGSKFFNPTDKTTWDRWSD